MRVKVTRRAERDLDDLVTYLAGRNPRAAIRYEDDLLDGVRVLLEQPYVGALTNFKSGQAPVRRLWIRNHGIYYTVTNETITILRFLHRAQDPTRSFD